MDAHFDERALARTLSGLGVAGGARLLVAFSGGLDSSVLLQAAAELRVDHGFTVIALHADHGLHPDSGRWVRHCEAVCRALDVPLETTRLSLSGGDGVEDTARRARYGWLAERLGRGDWLLTAHHRRDQAETVLLQLARGAGVAGLASMPPVAALGAGRHARPLLDVGPEALVAYARARGLVWVEDPANVSPRFDRSFLRAEVLPRLRSRWPAIDRTVARSARHLGEALEMLESMARCDLEATASGGRSLFARGASVGVSGLVALPGPRARLMLRAWIRDGGLRAPSERVLAAFLGAVATDRRAALQWSAGSIRRHRGDLFLLAPLPPAGSAAVAWTPPAPLPLEALGLRLRVETAPPGHGIARGRLERGQVEVRWRQGGERLRLAGRPHRHRLKKLMHAGGIPPWDRDRWPLVAVDGELALVPGIGVDASAAAGPGEPAVQVVVERV